MPLRVLHCPTMVGGNPQELARAERALGLVSSSVAFTGDYLNYSADRVLFGNNRLLSEVKRWHFISTFINDYDVIHYNFGMSLCPARVFYDYGTYPSWMKKVYNLLYGRWFELWDVKYAKYHGKVIAVTYQGDDARQGDYCFKNYKIHFAREVEKNYYSTSSDSIKRSRIEFFNKYADFIYTLNPDLLNVLPSRARFMPYANVDLAKWRYCGLNSTSFSSPLHIVHAPTNRLVKGTQYLLMALERLKREGNNFHYTLVEKMSNAESRKIYEAADLLVDQLLAGWYGGVSVEFMALGKPVICYIRKEDLRFIPKEMREDMPIINATPENIYYVLKECIMKPRKNLMQLGRASRKYVEKWHNPLTIAAALKKDYEDAFALKKIEHPVVH